LQYVWFSDCPWAAAPCGKTDMNKEADKLQVPKKKRRGCGDLVNRFEESPLDKYI
jgi:hypothetical protein